jgi:murein DD-endopeptidase MepM/ murein hydrolase activator NlpD
VEDISVKAKGKESVQGTECGNAVVIGHEGGLETQYCHMARGSVAVRPGDTVKAGQRIGRIGLSGLTEYPHLHFTVRLNGKVVDPFAPEEGGACGTGATFGRRPPHGRSPIRPVRCSTPGSRPGP